jgi:predicted amidohydrolase YtcJ
MPPSPGLVVFRNGTLFDGHRYAGLGSLVVDDGRIVAVFTGDSSGTDGFDADAVPGRAREVDLAGGLLAPGFVDAHVHPVQGGMERVRCDLSEQATREEYLAAIGQYAATHPDEAWILGGGWSMAAFPGGTPSAADLDLVIPDRPVFLPNRDHHGAWVNSRALEIAGITAATPDPEHGRIERDADGGPQGTLHEEAMWLVAQHAPDETPEDYHRGLLEGQRYLQSLGVTAWQDAIVGSYAGMQDPGEIYLAAARAGDLTSYVVGALWWDRELGEEQVESLVERRRRYGHERFRPTSVKIMQDGVAENFSAAMTTPYLDAAGRPTANSGHSFVQPDLLRRHVARLSDEGFQVHVHCIGDRAAREALDAFEHARAHLARQGREADLRHHIAHIQVVHPDDVPRFAELGVAANMQALWACGDDQMTDLTIPFLGAERSRWQYPFGDLHRAGARLVAGSDWPVSTPDPLAAIHTAVTRTTYSEPGPVGTEPFLPEQALDLETAFAAYTSGSSWVNHRDHAGVLREGAIADLVVLDRDPFAGPAEEIGATRVASTWVDGVPVFEA